MFSREPFWDHPVTLNCKRKNFGYYLFLLKRSTCGLEFAQGILENIKLEWFWWERCFQKRVFPPFPTFHPLFSIYISFLQTIHVHSYLSITLLSETITEFTFTKYRSNCSYDNIFGICLLISSSDFHRDTFLARSNIQIWKFGQNWDSKLKSVRIQQKFPTKTLAFLYPSNSCWKVLLTSLNRNILFDMTQLVL